ncbi:MAG TPA: hypothetical protein VN700_08185 [Vicinamibacterales bacterium]|nr:hypothetical protein [Vicinamibacterales bacterium]
MTKSFRLVLSLAIAVSFAAVTYAQDKKAPSGQDKAKAPAAEKWTGNISDAMCGKSHGANGGTMQKDHDCAVKCAAKGSYVFVSGDKIFKIADQKAKELEIHAGHRVEIEGTMKGDTITISKVTMLK